MRVKDNEIEFMILRGIKRKWNGQVIPIIRGSPSEPGNRFLQRYSLISKAQKYLTGSIKASPGYPYFFNQADFCPKVALLSGLIHLLFLRTGFTGKIFRIFSRSFGDEAFSGDSKDLPSLLREESEICHPKGRRGTNPIFSESTPAVIVGQTAM